MDIVGIICEYDPFHRGHKRQFDLIRSVKPDAYIVCLMSGCFTQRGMPAIYPTSVRARAALEAGCDLVLELPAAFSLQAAQHFARGGVEILHRLGFITHISFGCEDPPRLLYPIAKKLHELGNEEFPGMKDGLSYAAALAAYLEESLPGSGGILEKPNNILGIQYLRALLELGSPIEPLPVLRNGDYHSSSLADDTYPSASAIRKALLAGNRQAAEKACGYPLPQDSPSCLPHALDLPLLYRLRNMTPEEIAGYPCCSEGLENRILAAAKQCTSREELLRTVKTKRYPHTRLSRLLTQCLLGMDSELLQNHPSPGYVRLLGMRRESKPLLALLGNSPFPHVSKAADGDLNHPLYKLDVRAYDLWALGAGLPAGFMFRQQMVIL